MFASIKQKYENDEKIAKDEWFSYLVTPDDFQVKYLGVHYSLAGHVHNLFTNLWVLFLFIAYPFYLIICFILWAFRVLREGK